MLDVMDTAGQVCLAPLGDSLPMLLQEEYSALRDSYMKTGQGFLLCYDVTSLASFEQAMKLRAQIVKIKEDNEHVCLCVAVFRLTDTQIPIVLVGNKADLVEERVVKTVDAEAFAKQHNIGFLEGMRSSE